MGGRGRGRGGPGKSMSINVEALGFGRGNAMPTAALQPPPMFPPLQNPPLPLEESDKINYLVTLSRDLQNFMEDSPYYIKRSDNKNDIQRYSDKYKITQANNQMDPILWSLLPDELQPAVKKPKRKKKEKDAKSVLTAIDDLEKREAADGGDSGADEGSEADRNEGSERDENEEGDVDKEEEAEEDNDYLAEYFDNGEAFGDAEEDGLDDDAVF